MDNPSFSPRQFRRQARWTREVRRYLFSKIGLKDSHRLLEVGCGDGAILSDLGTNAAVYALDFDFPRLREAKSSFSSGFFLNADAHLLPFAEESFDVVFFHFFLLWAHSPRRALREMRRVLRVGGHLLAFAEPDYSRRVDKPDSLAPLGAWQREALRQRGANPDIGGNLAELFFDSGISLVETGTLSKGARSLPPNEREEEWATLEADLRGMVAAETLSHYKKLDEEAWARGERVLYVPVHYAWGRRNEV